MAQYYVDTAVGADGNAGTSAGTGNAWATINHAAAVAAAGDTVNVKASGTYAELATFGTNAGTDVAPITFVGYTSSPGDNGRVTWSGSGSRAHVGSIGKDYLFFRNFVFTSTTSTLFDITFGNVLLDFLNCRFTATAAGGAFGTSTFTNYFFRATLCEFDHLAASANGTFGADFQMYDCFVHDNTGDGLAAVPFRNNIHIYRTIIANNTGHGISTGSGSAVLGMVKNCIIHKNGGDGIHTTSASLFARYNLITQNLGWGFINASAVTLSCDYNAFYGNGIGNKSGFVGGGANDIIITVGSPYIDAAPETSGNYALNSTASRGALVRNVPIAFPNSLGTATNYFDLGAVQHLDAGGGAAGIIPSSFDGGF